MTLGGNMGTAIGTAKTISFDQIQKQKSPKEVGAARLFIIETDNTDIKKRWFCGLVRNTVCFNLEPKGEWVKVWTNNQQVDYRGDAFLKKAKQLLSAPDKYTCLTLVGALEEVTTIADALQYKSSSLSPWRGSLEEINKRVSARFPKVALPQPIDPFSL